MDIEGILDREGLTLAPNNKRILAFVIDSILISFVIFLAFLQQISSVGEDSMAIRDMATSMASYVAIITVLYHSIFTYVYGASIGKIFCKIKIVKVITLDKPNILDSIIRSIFRVMGEWLIYIPLLLIFADKYRRALHDIIVKTIVIDVSVPQDVD